MKRVIIILISIVLLTACGKQAPTWQEQYDLGVRYLSEGNYEEAIIAFTAAIEIDPNQALAYVGRGDAYIGAGETEEKLAAAQADYEKAIELGETLAEAYVGLADVYIRQGDYDLALEILQQGFEKVSDDKIEEKIHEVLAATDNFVNGSIVKFSPFDELDSSIQHLIESLMDKVITNPDEAVRLLSTDYIDLIGQEIAPKELRTMKNDYKIQMRFLNHGGSNPGGEFEMRPIEGSAYFCSGAYYNGCLHVDHGWGVCVNWNWNGSYEMIIMDSSGTSYIESGNCVDGLLDGAIYRPNSMYNTTEETYIPYYEIYNYGKEAGKIIYEDGREEIKDHREGNANDVFFYAGRTDIGWYKYWILW
ncbi:MAG: tetratricopeptide repeat protein [Oscillibacter sp.]|nr:tetratricopeptide repeat protein [Oscillibacter sp.]